MRLALNARASGVLFLGLFAMVWAVEAALRMSTLYMVAVCVIALGAMGALVAISLGLRKSAKDLPLPTVDELATEARADRWLYWCIAVEGVALFLIGGVLLPSLHLMSYLWPSIALVVGLHFYPLAYGLNLKVYYRTATLMCIVSAAAIGGLSGGYLSVAAWDTLVGIACAIVLLASCGFIVRDMRRSLTEYSIA